MTKNNYLIAVKEDGKEYSATVAGYTFEAGGLTFGVTNKDRHGKNIYEWVITELTSGLLVGNCSKRADAVKIAEAAAGKIKAYWKTTEKRGRFLVASLPTI